MSLIRLSRSHVWLGDVTDQAYLAFVSEEMRTRKRLNVICLHFYLFYPEVLNCFVFVVQTLTEVTGNPRLVHSLEIKILKMKYNK